MSMCAMLLLLAVLVMAIPLILVDAKLQAAIVLPHGGFAWDPTSADFVIDTLHDARQAANEIAAAARVAGQWLVGVGNDTEHASFSSGIRSSRSSISTLQASQRRRRRTRTKSLGRNAVAAAAVNANPDLVVLSTPHGMALSNDFALYLNEYAGGSAEIAADLHSSYTVTLPPIALAPQIATDLLEHLNEAGVSNVTGIYAPNDASLLGWGEVIPLLLIPRQSGEEATADRHRQHLILSHPQRRHAATVASMIPELLRLGHVMGQWLESLPLSVAIVISGDLSHRHEITPPGPYGYAPHGEAEHMDAALGAWAQDNPCSKTNARALLETAASLQPSALSCGYTGLVMLHGIMCGPTQGASGEDFDHQAQDLPQWKANLLVNRNVTYYGMMVAQFTRL